MLLEESTGSMDEGRCRDPVGVAGPGGDPQPGFATGCAWSERREIVAVASRSMARADAFGDTFGTRPAMTTTRQLRRRTPDVDVVSSRRRNRAPAGDTVMYVDAGKHVLSRSRSH